MLRIKRNLIKIYIRIYQLLHPIEKQVTFNSFNGMQYSDNPRAISEKLHELAPNYKIVWLMRESDNKNGEVPQYVRIVNYNGKNMFQEISKSKAYITNCELTCEFVKRKGQIFIQTWHGDICFKKMLLEVDKSLPVFDNKYMDYCLSGSEYGKRRYKTVFGYNGSILNTGSPRNDILFKNDTAEILKVKEKLGIDSNAMVLLFAPTFRDSNKEGLNIGFDIEKILKLLKKKTNKTWICLVRAHVGSTIIKSPNCIDVTSYPDMARILLIADYLISDYSSCATDFLIKDKPVILYQYDMEKYEKKDRKLDFDSKEAGFIVAETEKDLYKIVEHTSFDEFKKSRKQVWDYFQMNETGKASEIVAQIIINGRSK